MPSTRKSRLTAVCTLLMVALLTCVAYGLRLVEPRIRTFSGTLIELNLDSRTASLELPHPKTGEITQVTGEISPSCEVFRDGIAVEVSSNSLQAGDEVEVEVEIHPMGRRVVVRKATILTPASSKTEQES